jgi:AcrR family transcriptional regulator
MMPKLSLREKKNTEVKQALFTAAMELFRQNGFAATSVQAIAERAGYSRATYFNHFGTKQSVLRHYGQDLQERMAQSLVEVSPDSSPLERLREVLFAMAREADRHADDLKLIYRHSLSDPDYLARPTPARQRVFEMVCALVVEAQQGRGIRRDLPANVIAFHILSLYNGAVLAVVSGIERAEDTLQSAWPLILEGVRRGSPLAP